VALAVVALVVGIIISSDPGASERQLATNYVRAWADGQYARMYKMLDGVSRRQISEPAFAQEVRTATDTATLVALRLRRVSGPSDDTVDARVRMTTRLWGTLVETLQLPLTGSGSGARVHLAPQVLFPGLRPGESLSRATVLPPRASILASDGTPLAEGVDRTSPISDVAQEIVGTLGPIPATERALYSGEGYPPDAKVGQDGLERIFQSRLAGTPGGRLEAGRRVLATAKPVPAGAVTTTISPPLERAAISSLGGSYAGMAVMNPHTGAVLALAGIAFSATQPPGSTMKIITASAALEAGVAKLTSTYPVQTSATVGGYTLQNASGEACGGTLLNAFAVSCNSVFAPLGVKVGGRRLVAMAERFGFDQTPSILGAAESTIPSAAKIGNAVSVGSSAIGQGMVLTTPLEMTDVAATIANGGRRPIPTLLAHQPPRYVRVISPKVAGEVQRMMVAVVQFGTGTAAAIPGVTVAGKTGTAELKDTALPGAGGAQNTDAWFVGYAPVGHAKVVAGALFPNSGAGGQAAAPSVRQVLAAGLK
jgi:cell division protein FtsI/penicillin-binding protein 2